MPFLYAVIFAAREGSLNTKGKIPTGIFEKIEGVAPSLQYMQKPRMRIGVRGWRVNYSSLNNKINIMVIDTKLAL